MRKMRIPLLHCNGSESSLFRGDRTTDFTDFTDSEWSISGWYARGKDFNRR